MRIHILLLMLSALMVVSPANASAQNIEGLRANTSRLLAHVFTDSLPDADRIDLFHISGEIEPGKKKADVFELAGKNGSFAVTSKKTLRGKNCQKVIDAWRGLKIPDKSGGAFCHTPPYGIRFFRGDELILETTICWECHNFYVPEIDQQTGTLQLSLQNMEDRGNRLFQVLNEIIPIHTEKTPRRRTKP